MAAHECWNEWKKTLKGYKDIAQIVLTQLWKRWEVGGVGFSCMFRSGLTSLLTIFYCMVTQYLLYHVIHVTSVSECL